MRILAVFLLTFLPHLKLGSFSLELKDFSKQVCEFSSAKSNIDYEKVKYLPVQHEGRIKPLDTIARHALLLIHGSQTIKYPTKKVEAIVWLLDVMMNAKKAKQIKLIRIENRDLLKLLGSQFERKAFYSIDDLEPYFLDIYNLSLKIKEIEETQRDSFQRAVMVLYEQITVYLRISNTMWISEIDNVLFEFNDFKKAIMGLSNFGLEWYQKRYQFLSEAAYFNVVPSKETGGKWLNVGESLLLGLHSTIQPFVELISAYQQNDVLLFNDIIYDLEDREFPKIKFEIWYNALQPFLISSIIYACVTVISLLFWIFHFNSLKKLLIVLFFSGFLFHSFGLVLRMVAQGRPPVTNLYSSALFVGWSAALFALVIEYKSRNAISCAAGSIVGALTLLIAHHLSMGGDTMEALRAVLNSNFWLTIHVVTITLAYSTTFLAGGIGILYILRGFFTQSFDTKTADGLAKSVYGTICLSVLLSFTGTILGGFWADQAWGRFWGWDPKENGALLVILWNVMIMHAWIGKMIKQRGLIIFSVFGNIITALSWFGVNILSIGLHSYGFLDGSCIWLIAFIVFHCVIALLECFPKPHWQNKSLH